MHHSPESAGKPVSTSSSAAPHGQPDQAPGVTTPGWLPPLLSEIGHHALNMREVLARMLEDCDGTDDALNVAASNLASLVGMLADQGLARISEPGVMSGPQGWLMSPALLDALKQDGAVQ